MPRNVHEFLRALVLASWIGIHETAQGHGLRVVDESVLLVVEGLALVRLGLLLHLLVLNLI